MPFCIVPVRRNRLLSNVFVFLACKSVSNILPGYCSGTLEIMKKKCFRFGFFRVSCVVWVLKRCFVCFFFSGFTFKLVFIGRLSLVAACFCRFSLIFWCFFRSFPAAMAESGETLRNLRWVDIAPIIFLWFW